MVTRFFGLSPSSLSVRKDSKSILALVAASGSAAILLVVMAAVWAGSESDVAALERQKELVNARLTDQVVRVATDMRLLAAAYGSLLTSVEPTRERALVELGPISKFGDVVTPAFGYEKLFIVDRDGQLSMTDDPGTISRFKWIRPLLIGALRRSQDQEPKSINVEHTGETSREPSRVELMRLEGRPSIVGITPVPNRQSGVAGSANGASELYLIAFRFLDGAVLDTLSREQGLNGARYARNVDAEAMEVAFEMRATASLEPIGFIIWTPDLPGSRVIERLTPALSVGASILATLFFVLIVRLNRSWTALKRSEKNARYLSLHDVLTTLPNRGLFNICLNEHHQALTASSRATILACIDLDRFKAVNDSYGHAVGDELILSASKRMLEVIGTHGMLARLGGDEFALLLPQAGDERSCYLSLCERLVEEMKRPFVLRQGEVTAYIGCSIGIAKLFEQSQTPREVLRQADVALYHAKATGRGCFVVYDAAIEVDRLAKKRLTDDLRAELVRMSDRRDGLHGSGIVGILPPQVEVFYQTVHRAGAEKEISGAEALVRWRHPDFGLLTPDRFIPLAEESGLIDQLGKFVLEEACAVACEQLDAAMIAVNVSPKQLRRPDFADEVLSILEKTGLPPSRLELELTETALLDSTEEARATLARLRGEGIKVALDDFGTGYSSLSHLIHFGIDRIKIDRSFVRLLDSNSHGAAIAAAVTGLGRSLGIATTAEGVETEAQRDFLVAIGCSDLQGYLFSRPVPADQLPLAVPLLRIS